MAKVLTGISGNLISAASAGFAPTNSADVSAIASAYQVVSATATQLYAGTAYVTSVNGAPLSASRAGNAANASLANSAWYDGTGRLISSLPDSAAVSAIASAYQVVSSTATAVTGETAYLTSVNGTPISAARAGDAAMASVAAKAYTDPDGRYLVDLVDIETLDSWTSGKQDTLTFAYNADSAISSINGSALAGQGGGGGSVASPSGTITVTDGTAIEATNSAIGTAEGFEVLGSSGTYSYSYGSFYASLGGYNPFKARGIGITYISSTGDRTASVSANTPDGNFEASFELPASSVSAGVIFSDTPIYSVYDIKLKVNGSTVTLSGTNPALFLTPGTPYTVVKELAWKEDVPTIDLGIYSDYYGTYVSSINGAELSASMAFSSRSAASASYAKNDMQGRAISALAEKSSIPTGVTSPNGTIIANVFSVDATNSAITTSTVAGYPLQPVPSTGTQIGPGVYLDIQLPSENPNTTVLIPLGWASYDPTTISAIYNGVTSTSTADTGLATAVVNVPNATSVRVCGSVYRSVSNSASASAESGTSIGGVAELAWASALPTYEYDAEDKISAINGSAIAGGAGGATGDYVEKSATSVTIGTSNTAGEYSLAIGSGNYIDRSESLVVGTDNSADLRNIAVGAGNSADLDSIAVGFNNASYIGAAIGQMNTGERNSLALGMSSYASNNSIAVGKNASAEGNPYSLGGSIAVGLDVSAGDGSYAVGGSSIATDVSFAHGFSLSATHSAAVFGTYNLSGDGSGSSGAAFVLGDGTASNARHDLMVVTRDGEITMYSSTADTTGTGIMSSIRALSANAGGVDSATVSAIASSYAESAASSKLDTTAFNSADFYSTSNPSGFIDSAYAESAVSGKADSSALSSYALSADVSGTVDLVSTQSANWGGSALALSAGPGVKLEKVGNTLVASTDETLLWSGDYAVSQVSSIALNESWKNFQIIKMYGTYNESTMFLPLNGEACVNEYTTGSGFELPLTTNGFATWSSPSAFWVNVTVPCLFTASTGMKVESARLVGRWNGTWQAVNTINGNAHVSKVVGINRTAEA